MFLRRYLSDHHKALVHLDILYHRDHCNHHHQRLSLCHPNHLHQAYTRHRNPDHHQLLQSEVFLRRYLSDHHKALEPLDIPYHRDHCNLGLLGSKHHPNHRNRSCTQRSHHHPDRLRHLVTVLHRHSKGHHKALER